MRGIVLYNGTAILLLSPFMKKRLVTMEKIVIVMKDIENLDPSSRLKLVTFCQTGSSLCSSSVLFVSRLLVFSIFSLYLVSSRALVVDYFCSWKPPSVKMILYNIFDVCQFVTGTWYVCFTCLYIWYNGLFRFSQFYFNRQWVHMSIHGHRICMIYVWAYLGLIKAFTQRYRFQHDNANPSSVGSGKSVDFGCVHTKQSFEMGNYGVRRR